MSAPCEHGIGLARGEGDRDPCGLVPAETRAVGVGVAADGDDCPAVEREAAGNWCHTSASDLRIRRDSKRGGRAASGDTQTRIGIGHGTIKGRGVIESVLPAAGRVPLDGQGVTVVQGCAQVAEQHAVRD